MKKCFKLFLRFGLNNILFRASIHLQHINKIWHKDLTVSHLAYKRHLLKLCNVRHY